MEIAQAQQVKKAVEKFFTKVRINVALTAIIKSQKYLVFESNIKDAIHKQILYFAKVEKINQLAGVSKAVGTLPTEDVEILDNVRKYWIPILALLDEQEVKDYLVWVANKGGQSGLDKLNIDQKFSLTNKSLLDQVISRAGLAATEIDGTTQDWIARTVSEGMQGGLSHVEIAKMLRDSAIKQAEIRSNLIAENESALMVGEIENQVMARNGIESHEWVTQRDELTCEICMSNEEAGIIRVGEMFPSGVTTTPAHARCRCFTLPVIPDNLEEIWMGQ